MCRTQMCGLCCCHKYRQIIICLIILFASTSHILFMAEAGRAISNLNQVSKGLKEGESMLVGKAQVIGSRPPKCERRCRSCGHCEAVQVPIVPQVKSHTTRHYYSSTARKATTVVITYSTRGDYLSNYKPISWKCKCGDYFFNP